MNKFFAIFSGLLAIFVISFFLFQSFSNDADNESVETEQPVLLAEKVPSRSMSPVYTAEMPQQLNFAGEAVPLDIFYVKEGLDRELTVNTYFHSSTILLLKRANRWFPVIEPILAENNIPEDFKYLAMIESGLDNASSPAGAEGFWQFLKHTAREYGLEVNSGIDERYNVEKSTKAACDYLNESYEKYGNWTLVAAAYNAGNRRISEELDKQEVNSYYDLFLNEETSRYVYRILAIKTIMNQPDQYGFHLQDSDLYPPIPTTTVTVNHTVRDLVQFAADHQINYKTLKYFNPWLLKDYLPDRSRRIYLLKIPVSGAISSTPEESTSQLE